VSPFALLCLGLDTAWIAARDVALFPTVMREAAACCILSSSLLTTLLSHDTSLVCFVDSTEPSVLASKFLHPCHILPLIWRLGPFPRLEIDLGANQTLYCYAQEVFTAHSALQHMTVHQFHVCRVYCVT
jgi:hypothetical protein